MKNMRHYSTPTLVFDDIRLRTGQIAPPNPPNGPQNLRNTLVSELPIAIYIVHIEGGGHASRNHSGQ